MLPCHGVDWTVGEELEAAKSELAAIQAEAGRFLATLPNTPHISVPEGA